MASREIGNELNQLSRILFDAAAANWYAAAGIEVCAGVLGALLSVTGVAGDWGLVGAVVGLALLAWAYYLRLRFDDQYELAETMRRQSILIEALAWPVERVQASEWRRRAGRKTLDRFRAQSRESDYYSTAEPEGPARLAEMTLESAFYTRHLYGKLRILVWALFGCALLISALALAVPALEATPAAAGVRIASAVYLLLPVLLTIDLLGWAIRLGRLIAGIRDIEANLERLQAADRLDLPQVMRLVSEYNCQVIAGFPIHPRLFSWWHDEISELWRRRSA